MGSTVVVDISLGVRSDPSAAICWRRVDICAAMVLFDKNRTPLDWLNSMICFGWVFNPVAMVLTDIASSCWRCSCSVVTFCKVEPPYMLLTVALHYPFPTTGTILYCYLWAYLKWNFKLIHLLWCAGLHHHSLMTPLNTDILVIRLITLYMIMGYSHPIL